MLRCNYFWKHKCRFVCAPDVVCDSVTTLKKFHEWKGELKKWPIAFVLQDGFKMDEVPWNEIKAIFIGGSNRFKDSYRITEAVQIAQSKGLWVHVGRVNGPSRVNRFESLNVNSIDGTGISRYTRMRTKIADFRNEKRLF